MGRGKPLFRRPCAHRYDIVPQDFLLFLLCVAMSRFLAARSEKRPPRASGSGVRALLWQGLLLAAIAGVVWFLVSTLADNLAARRVATGFGFLGEEAGFAIGESLIAYGPTDTYLRAISVGLANTLLVALIGAVLATLLGVLIGLARLARNSLLSGLASSYIELMRNIPLLLQLLFWYALYTETLPRPRHAWEPLAGVFLSNRGMHLPLPVHEAGQAWWAGWSWQFPVLDGFNFVGGVTLSPELAALLTGLVLYTAAFMAEIVRAGVQAVSRGQWQAGTALGLSRVQVLRAIVLPQALRIIVPPMTSQYLNLTKNSSLAVAIGYPDLVSVVNTTILQTGQAVEGVLIIMAAYLTVSLAIAGLMNLYNYRLSRRGQRNA